VGYRLCDPEELAYTDFMLWGTRAGCTAVLFALLLVPQAAADTFDSGPVTYVTEDVNLLAGGANGVTAFCPADRNVSGGGAAIAGQTGESDDADISTLRPADTGDGGSIPDDAWIADASNEDNIGHVLTTTAICVKTSKADVSYPESEGSVGAGNVSGGTFVSCLGGEITGSGLDTNSASPDLVELEALEHSFSGKEAIYTGVGSGYTKEGAGIDYTAFGLCTDAELKHRYESRVIFGPVTTLKAKCPKGTRVLGGGFSRYPTDLLASAPFDGKDGDDAPDDGWRVKMRTLSPLAGFAYTHCLE
jgi:hypothetical protein